MATADTTDHTARIPRSRADKIFDLCNYTILSVIFLIILYPLYFIVISSFSEPTAVNSGNVSFWPKGFTMEGYRIILNNNDVWRGYGNTILYTVLNVAISLAIMIPGGYALSRKELAGRNMLMLLIVFTMFFSGGMIPTYMIVKNLGMVDTIWALFVPSAASAYYVIVIRTFFQNTLPEEMYESAKVDGCSTFRYFFSMVIPLSTPIIAVMALFTAVSQWNSFFSALIYLQSSELYPLQLILRSILIASQMSAHGSDAVVDPESIVEAQRYAELIKYALIMVASLPVLALYPFLQRFFVKGMMIGSVKG
ncbi:carbohydrate ABC transporter permease [Paenibacillus nasutitermitis]|uniref:Sugar ABC transporter permease n=1 Tax=Paenibacillus nasutitermitis TaxID=1652958 RepID=A0A916ZFF1_9BACL|nr:carbohydrate ABC transporter permease [Paenibacillus nasutitermitis]GGD94159.1 sugar ABC transporter permease [Paenibacillus nasutitermitis]